MDTKRISGQPNLENIRSSQTDRADNVKARNSAKSDAKISEGSNSKDYGLNVSSKARELAEVRARALEIAKSTPSVREDKVDALRSQILSGQYKMDSGKIADGMMKEAIRDDLSMRLHQEASLRK